MKNILKGISIIHRDRDYDVSGLTPDVLGGRFPVVCAEHGVFFTTLKRFLYRGIGCPKCKDPYYGSCFRAKTVIRLRVKGQQKYQFDDGSPKYDYSETWSINNYSKVYIKCNSCSKSFETTAAHHLTDYHAGECPDCYSTRRKLTTEEFIQRSKEMHGDKYGYEDSVITDGAKTLVSVHCRICDKTWEITANNHLRGKGCRKCNPGRVPKSTEEFILDSYKIHQEKYNYKLTDYVTNDKKVKIICNVCKQIFEQAPHTHLGDHGCPDGCYHSYRVINGKPGYVSYDRQADKIAFAEKVERGNHGELLVECKKCKSMFAVTSSQTTARTRSMNSSNSGECSFYCSDKCKSECETFGRSVTPKNLDSLVRKARGCQSRSKRVLVQIQKDECGYTYCERCGGEYSSVDLHHTVMVGKDPNGSISEAGHILLCEECHVVVHRTC